MSAKLIVTTHYADVMEIGRRLRLPMICWEGYDWEPIYYSIGFEVISGQHAFLESNSGIVYSSYSEIRNGKTSELRIRHFDLVRALGLKEAWAMDENAMDFYDDFYEPSDSIEKMNEIMAQGFGYEKCPEFSLEEQQKTGFIRGIYHDQYKDCFDLVDRIEKEYGVSVLGLNDFWGFIRVVKNDKVMFLNYETGDMKGFTDCFKHIEDLEREEGCRAIDLSMDKRIRIFKDGKVLVYDITTGRVERAISSAKLKDYQ